MQGHPNLRPSMCSKSKGKALEPSLRRVSFEMLATHQCVVPLPGGRASNMSNPKQNCCILGTQMGSTTRALLHKFRFSGLHVNPQGSQGNQRVSAHPERPLAGPSPVSWEASFCFMKKKAIVELVCVRSNTQHMFNRVAGFLVRN